MKFLNSDFLVIAVNSIIISTFSALLYLDFHEKIDTGKLNRIGNIIFKRNIAQRKYNKQVIWENLFQNQDLYNPDTVRTANLSEVILRLRDGTAIELDENSMIYLSLSKNLINIDFSHGTIYARRDNIQEETASILNII